MLYELNDFYREHKDVLVGGVLTRYFDSDVVVRKYAEDERAEVERPIVVALHGVATSGFLYRHLVAEFDGPVRLIIPDLPGFGRSTKKLPWAAGTGIRTCPEGAQTHGLWHDRATMVLFGKQSWFVH